MSACSQNGVRERPGFNHFEQLGNQKKKKKCIKSWLSDFGQRAAQVCDPKKRKTSTLAPDYCLEAD